MIQVLVSEGVTVMTGLFDQDTTGPYGSGAELRFELSFEESRDMRISASAGKYLAHLHQQLDHQHPHFTIASSTLHERVTPQTLLQWAQQELSLFFSIPEDFGQLKELRVFVRSEGLSWSIQFYRSL